MPEAAVKEVTFWVQIVWIPMSQDPTSRYPKSRVRIRWLVGSSADLRAEWQSAAFSSRALVEWPTCSRGHKRINVMQRPSPERWPESGDRLVGRSWTVPHAAVKVVTF